MIDHDWAFFYSLVIIHLLQNLSDYFFIMDILIILATYYIFQIPKTIRVLFICAYEKVT